MFFITLSSGTSANSRICGYILHIFPTTLQEASVLLPPFLQIADIQSIGFVIQPDRCFFCNNCRRNGFLICKQDVHLIAVIPILCYRCRFELPIIPRSAVYLCLYPAELWQLNRVITDLDVPVCDICCIRFFRFMLTFILGKSTEVFKKAVISIFQMVNGIG